jgi:glycosyltransferase involved in cell wall biosynthesis
VPAHNEADVIERCLGSLLAGAARRPLEIVVVCNGCTDDTAALARRAAPEAVVVETEVSSKHAALNLGDQVATTFPRCYVDADVVVSPGALDRVADALARGDVLAAAPRPAFDLSRSGPGARRFLELWQHAPYFTDDLVGSGFYALSEQGRKRFEAFPPVVADDYFIASSFPARERLGVDGCTFTPLLPVSLKGLVDIHIRHYAAHAELAAWLAATDNSGQVQLDRPTRGGWLTPFLVRPAWWTSIVVYLGVKAAARMGGRYKHKYGKMSWNRDQAGRDSLARDRHSAREDLP